MSVFLDANILFSGSHPKNALRRFLIWLKEKEMLVTSPYALSEAERNITVKRPDWLPYYKELISYIRIVPEAPLTINAGLPEKDRPILGAAIAAGCAYLLTGDKKDFGHLYGQTTGGVTVTDILGFTGIMLEKHG